MSEPTVQERLAVIQELANDAISVQQTAHQKAEQVKTELKQLQKDIATGKVTTGNRLRDYVIYNHSIANGGGIDQSAMNQWCNELMLIQNRIKGANGHLIAVVSWWEESELTVSRDFGLNISPHPEDYHNFRHNRLEMGILTGDQLVVSREMDLGFPTGGQHLAYETGGLGSSHQRGVNPDWESTNLPVAHYPTLKLDPPPVNVSPLLLEDAAYLIVGNEAVKSWLSKPSEFKYVFDLMWIQLNHLFLGTPPPPPNPAVSKPE